MVPGDFRYNHSAIADNFGISPRFQTKLVIVLPTEGKLVDKLGEQFLRVSPMGKPKGFFFFSITDIISKEHKNLKYRRSPVF
jgi:hypothetical protein